MSFSLKHRWLAQGECCLIRFVFWEMVVPWLARPARRSGPTFPLLALTGFDSVVLGVFALYHTGRRWDGFANPISSPA